MGGWVCVFGLVISSLSATYRFRIVGMKFGIALGTFESRKNLNLHVLVERDRRPATQLP